ncbi:hypothetical protein BDP81DRAFT_83346 [Colletotrichum phormii]|uniref:Uncharacterized protein n=1 Tax=Colletotrichum phormii TaxID=359342 RepID=A0AAJ0A0X6_9PEZI|nr:uncharacterized protein BDP81DRAFT_83346 [Colletotrichum phormii]KAK1654433.1 hypothetical protein BDP81DRAFT_83346 [Colletotrichum phormii]
MSESTSGSRECGASSPRPRLLPSIPTRSQGFRGLDPFLEGFNFSTPRQLRPFAPRNKFLGNQSEAHRDPTRSTTYYNFIGAESSLAGFAIVDELRWWRNIDTVPRWSISLEICRPRLPARKEHKKRSRSVHLAVFDFYDRQLPTPRIEPARICGFRNFFMKSNAELQKSRCH